MKNISIIVLFCLLIGCRQSNTTEPPPDLLPQAKFTEVHKEVRLLEGAYAAKYVQVDTSTIKIDSYYKKLFLDHNITAEQYKTSLSYYSKDPIIMMAIENDLLTQLTAMQTAQDSINRSQNEQLLDTLKVKNQ